MNSRKTEFQIGRFSHISFIVFSLAITISLSSCARKPWSEPLAENSRLAVLQVVDEMREIDARRSRCIDTDVNIFFTSHMKNRAISGYVQLMQPISIKFISSNPFGQPLFAFVSNGENFQYVNTLDQLFLDGKVADFARLYDVPSFVVIRSWGQWLTGRMPDTTHITDIRRDRSDRGVWVSVDKDILTKDAENGATAGEHLLIDSEKKLLLGRIYTSRSGDTEARIFYSDWLDTTAGSEARQPGEITVSGLDYGGEIVLKFSALQEMEDCRARDFSLRKPSGYSYQPLSIGSY